MAEKDISEKILESYNDVFADIVNVLLFDGEIIIRPEELIDQNPRAAYKADGKLREIERDVAKQWTKSNIRIACIGLENQTIADADMPMRVIGYDGAEYRTQLSRGSERYPVVTLVLYFGTDRHWDKARSLYEALDIPEEFKPYVQDYRINLFEIAYLDPDTVKKFRSDFRIVADYFVQKRMHGEYQPSAEKIEHVQAVLQLLRVMTNDHRFEEVANNSQEGEHTNMCEILDKLEARKEAQVNERVATDMLKEGAALSFIQRISKLSEEAIRAIAKKINVEVVEE
ncbi:MAG: Rpn family recombination-promoting nuclease/putative transposase [Clostridia bacterium]|nr:Rpn family recombination-promoting nuclease/putative transposase [Clostridia bacterium]